ELNETKSKVHSDFEDLSFNSLESTKASFLILASGVAFRYAKEAAQAIDSPHIDVAKLTSTHPIPQKTILKWLQGRKRVLFIEEVDPFIEEQVLSLYAELEVYETELGRIEFYGKQNGFVPAYGELNTDIVLGALAKILRIDRDKLKVAEEKGINLARELLIPRPLTFCAGCTHRNIYWAIRKIRKRLKEGLVVAGDIGCYSLGVFYDGSMNTMQAMGSGIGTATGLGQLHRFGFEKKVIAVAGDSTFFHACIPALINARHKNANITFLILDNATTAMTGFQLHPGTDPGEKDLTQVSIERIVNAIGPDLFEAVDATDIDATTDTLHRIVQMKGLKVLLCKSICRLEEKKDRAKEPRVFIASEACHGEKCRICVSEFACPALEWDQSKGVARIIKHACIRCGTCIAVCPHAAIQKEGLD
ncbi:MAG: thiamine pyrophosphate-dependent enzyme, partial [Candidatus Thorarchaeota archaeon]